MALTYVSADIVIKPVVIEAKPTLQPVSVPPAMPKTAVTAAAKSAPVAAASAPAPAPVAEPAKERSVEIKAAPPSSDAHESREEMLARVKMEASEAKNEDATAEEKESAPQETREEMIARVKKESKEEGAEEEVAEEPEEEEEDDFDVFGEDDDDEPKEEEEDDEVAEDGKETRKQMLARLKKEAEERTAKKEAKQRTLVAIEVKPWSIEQDLVALWKKITETITQDGLKWGESCTLADVAFGIKKIQCTFVMGVNNSSDDVIEAILAMEDDVQSAEVTSMNVL